MLKLVVLSCFLAVVSSSAVVSYGFPLLEPFNYRGPLSLAPGQPASILGADGRPLDTLDVNLDRAAHYNAKALEGGFHLLKKRSVSLYATPFASPIATYAASLPLAYSAPLWQPYNYRGPLSLAPGQPANILGADGRPLDTLEVNQDRAAHIAAKSGLHILKKRSAALVAPASNIALAHSSIIPSTYAVAAPNAAPIAPISYSAYSPLAYSAYSPLAYSAYSPLAYSAYSPLAYSTPFATFFKK